MVSLGNCTFACTSMVIAQLWFCQSLHAICGCDGDDTSAAPTAPWSRVARWLTVDLPRACHFTCTVVSVAQCLHSPNQLSLSPRLDGAPLPEDTPPRLPAPPRGPTTCVIGGPSHSVIAPEAWLCLAMGDADLDLYEDVDDFNIKVKYTRVLHVFCRVSRCAIFNVLSQIDVFQVYVVK